METVYKQSARSTEDPATRRAQKSVPLMREHLATSAGGYLWDNLLMVAAARIGAVVEMLSSRTVRSAATAIVEKPHSEAGAEIAKLCTDVEYMKTLRPDWNGLGSEPPSRFAIDSANEILLDATNIVMPSRVTPSAEGGIGICFYVNNKYADIECFNTGEVLATISDGTGNPKVWEVKPTKNREALERIGKFIAS